MVTATSSKPRLTLAVIAIFTIALFLVTLPVSILSTNLPADVLERGAATDNSYFSIATTLPAVEDLGGQTPSSWMSKLGDDLPITAINIPATHDSTARYGGDSYACQSLPLPDQLALGVRFLDIRLSLADGVLKCQHGRKYQNLQFKDVLTVVQTFLSANPTEGVFIKIQQEHTSYSSLDFSAAVATALSTSSIVFNASKPMTNETLPVMSELRGRMMVLPRFFDLKEYNTIPYEWLTAQDNFHASIQSKTDSILSFYNLIEPTTNVAVPSTVSETQILQARRHRKHEIPQEQKNREALGLAMNIGWNVNYFSLHNNRETPASAAYILNPLIALMIPQPSTGDSSLDAEKIVVNVPRELQTATQPPVLKQMGIIMMDFIGPGSTELIIASNFQA